MSQGDCRPVLVRVVSPSLLGQLTAYYPFDDRTRNSSSIVRSTLHQGCPEIPRPGTGAPPATHSATAHSSPPSIRTQPSCSSSRSSHRRVVSDRLAEESPLAIANGLVLTGGHQARGGQGMDLMGGLRAAMTAVE